MTDCEYCHKEIKKDDDFVLAGKYPSGWQKLPFGRFLGMISPEDFGRVYHKSCFLEMMDKDKLKRLQSS